MTFEYLLGFVLALFFACFLTPLVISLAKKNRLVDIPDQGRKIQTAPVPLGGGASVFFSFAFVIVLWVIFSPHSFGAFIQPRFLLGIICGGIILMIGGYLDDKYRLPPKFSIIAPILAVAAVLASGVQLSYINSPFGGAVLLDTIKIYGYPLLGGIFVFIWILGMIYTTKFLDGMDGLVSGISSIGAVAIFLVSQIPSVSQPDTALLSIIFAGAMLGFLPWNFHPARIFLGEGGSTFAGFLIGTLAVISGGKIATALLVMGIPILDTAWVIIRRLLTHYSPFSADRKHLHFRLLDLGLSHRQAVLFLYFLSASFGASAIYLQAWGKLVALIILLATMVILASVLVWAYNKKIQNAKLKTQNES